MIKDIKYNGYTAQPADYQAPDGDLDIALNLINEDTALKPMPVGGDIIADVSGYTVLAIHELSTGIKNLILSNGASLYYRSLGEDTEEAAFIASFYGKHVLSVSCIGNTLAILTNLGVEYALWRDNKYISLGEIPIVDLEVKIGSSAITDGEIFTVNLTQSPSNNSIEGVDIDRCSNAVMGAVVKMINDGCYTYQPFLLRYALRLFDGTYTHHSSPVLIRPAFGTYPFVSICDGAPSGKKTINCQVHMPYVFLTLRFDDDQVRKQLALWKDIITGIDIFVSAPFYTFDQNGKVTSFYKNPGHNVKILSGYRGSVPTDREYGFMLPYKSQAELAKEISDCSIFRFAASYLPTKKSSSSDTSGDELVYDNTFNFKLADINVNSINTKTTLPDDLKSRENLIPRTAFVYNGRLNITDCTKNYQHNCTGAAFIETYTDAEDDKISDLTTFKRNQFQILVRFLTRVDNHEDYYQTAYTPFPTATTLAQPRECIPYLYHPDRNVYKAIIQFRRRIGDTSNPNTPVQILQKEVDMRPHDFLNGAFYCSDKPTAISESDGFTDVTSGSTLQNGAHGTVSHDVLGKIYVSDVNNPFTFPFKNTVTIPGGVRVFGLSSAAKALSQGQFGQFPLYAFTDSGVWAIEVAADGSFIARQPITRDVILENTKPLQIDSAVIFATARGIMLLSGSSCTCISDSINADVVFNTAILPHFNKLHSDANDHCLPLQSLSSLLTSVQMTYDYTNQRLVFFNPIDEGTNYALVFSLKSKKWSMMHANFKAAVPSYPDAYVLDNTYNLINLSAAGSQAPFLLLTRPLKLDTPDILKTIDTVIQRGHFRKGHVQSVLYGSRDLFNWQLVWSSKDHFLRGFRGTPYKYYRIALLGTLDADESIYGASIQFSPRQTNQPR